MVKNHLARLNAPKSWPIKRKGIQYILRPAPGAHDMRHSIPMSLVLTNLLKYARTAKEVKKILHEGKVKVNDHVVKDRALPVGIMDVVALPSIKETYKVLQDTKGKFMLIALDGAEAGQRAVKIQDKTIIKGGKVQLNNTDGSILILLSPDTTRQGIPTNITMRVTKAAS